MAAIAAVAAVSAAFTTLHLSKPKFILTTTAHRHIRTLISASLSPSSSSTTTTTTTEFNITFAPPKPKLPKSKPKPQPDPSQTLTSSSKDDRTDESGGDEFYIPWIVRDENGNLTLQTTPPARLLQAMANANTGKKKKEKDAKAKHSTPTAAPKLSKGARRFYNENFRDSPEQRLSKVLAAAGVASRRSSEELIFGGKVTVNGSICTAPQTKVDPRRDMIYVNGNRLAKKLPPKVYFALNKPKGYICSCGEEEKSVVSLFDDYMKSWDKRNPGVPKPRLFTVGRLDVPTSGLIIVTNDGEFAQKLTHPSSNVSKEYIATIDGSISKSQLIAIGEGTVVEGVRCVPDVVELLPQQPDVSRPRVKVVVHDGRNHEVREIVKHAGLQIYALKRIRIGGFRLPSDLGIGKHIELNTANLRALGWKP